MNRRFSCRVLTGYWPKPAIYGSNYLFTDNGVDGAPAPVFAEGIVLREEEVPPLFEAFKAERLAAMKPPPTVTESPTSQLRWLHADGQPPILQQAFVVSVEPRLDVVATTEWRDVPCHHESTTVATPAAPKPEVRFCRHDEVVTLNGVSFTRYWFTDCGDTLEDACVVDAAELPSRYSAFKVLRRRIDP